MSSPSPTSSAHAPAETESERPATPAESDASCRLPVTLMFFSAALWLLLSAGLSLLASVKCHSPKLLEDCPVSTYGHLQAAANSLILYGFAVQAGLGVMLWMFSRLGKTILFQPVLATFGAMFWNLGVTVGMVGIFAGDQSGFEWLEFPKYANGLLLVGYIVIGLVAALTFHDRNERTLEPSHWYLLGALFWFPWIFSTATMLLQVWPTRGVMLAVVNNWFGANLVNMWLAFIGIAIVFYLLPLESKRPLHSRYLAMFSFWTLALFGGWGGMNAAMPVPAWLPGLTTLFNVVSIVAVLAVAWNLHFTFGREFHLMKSNTVLAFMVVGASAYVIYGALTALTSIQEFNTITHFTYFSTGILKLALYGFAVLILSGAMYYILPRVTGSAWPNPGLIRLHLWLTGAGTAILVLFLCNAGWFQGYGWNVGYSFLEVAEMKWVKMSFRMSTLGELMILVGQLVMLGHFGLMARDGVRECLKCACGSKTKTVGVAA